MKTSIRGQVVKVPMRSITYPLDERSPMALQINTAKIADDKSSVFNRCRVHSILSRMNKFGRKAESSAHGIKENARVGPKITETVRNKLRIIKSGGVEKIFNQLFHAGQDEKLFKTSQCYLSTSDGPIAGLLFISSHKIAFCSQKSIKFFSQDGELNRARYKVVIPVSKLERVSQCENVKKPSQKYIEIVTVDNFDFWFMGFLNHKKAFKCLQQSVL